MAFKAFEENVKAKQFLPWCNEYYAKHPLHVDATWDVNDVKLTEKGMILECQDWAAWLWKSNKMHNFVIQFIESWYTSKKASPVMQLQLTAREPYFAIGTDDERNARWGKTTQVHWHQGYDTASDNPACNENPLPLPPSASSEHMQSEAMPNMTAAMPEITHDLSHVNEPGTPLNGKGSIKPRSKG